VREDHPSELFRQLDRGGRPYVVVVDGGFVAADTADRRRRRGEGSEDRRNRIGSVLPQEVLEAVDLPSRKHPRDRFRHRPSVVVSGDRSVGQRERDSTVSISISMEEEEEEEDPGGTTRTKTRGTTLDVVVVALRSRPFSFFPPLLELSLRERARTDSHVPFHRRFG